MKNKPIEMPNLYIMSEISLEKSDLDGDFLCFEN